MVANTIMGYNALSKIEVVGSHLEIVNMASKIKLPNLDDLVRRYRDGESIAQLARDWEVSSQTITRRLKSAGVHRDRSHWGGGPPVDLPIEEIAARYLRGESPNKLASAFGVARKTITDRLAEHGIELRGHSDWYDLWWNSLTGEERAAHVAPAHEANRGTKRSRETLIKIAHAREQNLSHVSPAENELAEMLRAKGYTVTQQKALGVYNVDIAIHAPSITVEIFGGQWHAYGHHRRRHMERIPHLFNWGWHVVIVWAGGVTEPLSLSCANYIHSLAKKLSREPSFPRQYRVIWGNGKLAPIASSYLNTPAVVEALGCRFDPAGSHHFISGQDT